MTETIKIFGDKYIVKKTYDINDTGLGIYGYEIYDDNKKFLRYFEGIENLIALKNYIKINFYKSAMKAHILNNKIIKTGKN